MLISTDSFNILRRFASHYNPGYKKLGCCLQITCAFYKYKANALIAYNKVIPGHCIVNKSMYKNNYIAMCMYLQMAMTSRLAHTLPQPASSNLYNACKYAVMLFLYSQAT